jgi:hypothetical protein
MRQAPNKVEIVGILSEVDIKEGVGKASGKAYVMGEMKIKVEQDVNGETQNIEVPVSLFATKEKKAGGINPAYEAIQKIKTEYTSIAACGDESKATCVKIERGELGENAFYGGTGTLVSMPRIRTSFTKRISPAECDSKAIFQVTIVIGKIADEVKNGEPTGRLLIKGIIPQYGDKVDVVDFVVASDDAINHIRAHWYEGDTVTVAGKINFSSKTIREEKQVGFGEPLVEEKTVSVKELVILSGSASGLDGDAAYDSDEINLALKNRMATLEKAKQDMTRKTAPAAPKSASFGF